MKTSTRSSAALAHVAKLIEGIPIRMLTTIESDGWLANPWPLWWAETKSP